MRRFAGRSLLFVVASTVALAAATAPAMGSSLAPWQDHPRPMSPSLSSTNNWLNGVSASSETDAWAVGGYLNDTTDATDTLILHWNGDFWGQVGSPNPSSTYNILYAVRAVSATNAWAVGDHVNDATGAQDTLILHWNGTVWSRVASPNPSATTNILNGVAISSTSPKSGWAVGESSNGKTGVVRTLTLRWNGSVWSRVASPDPSKQGNFLSGVRAPSPTNAWAVGYLGHQLPNRTLILHWNGRAWARVTSPNPSSTSNDLLSTGGASPTNAWAVGTYRDDDTGGLAGLIVHWNGTAWSKVASPNPSSAGTLLTAVRVESAADAWAVGDYLSGPTDYHDTLVLHWDGTAWSQVPTPNPGFSVNYLEGVTATSATDAWAVGWYDDSMGNEHPLILHWDGATWAKM